MICCTIEGFAFVGLLYFEELQGSTHHNDLS